MKTLNLIQGSPEWHAHRSTYLNASDAPAMMGVSKYKTRSQLLQERATGIAPEVNAATQRLFDDGHRFEALARPLAERLIGDELMPVTGTNGMYSASFDGITFDGCTIFEHKTLNQELRACTTENDLADQYRIQMEHQLLVSDADSCLFMASQFNADDELVEEIHFVYYPDMELRARILAGWAQFALDLAEYQRKLAAGEIEPPKETPRAEAIIALPSVFVQATGMVTASNLPEFKAAADTFISAINTELVTDSDFANAEATIKFCKDAESNCEAQKTSVLAQMSTVDEVVRALDHIAAQLRDKRLMLDKLVKSEKELRKSAIVTTADKDFTAYAMQLEEEIKPISLNRAAISSARQSFAEAIKGKKKLDAMQEAVDTALRNAKFAADQEAADIRRKLAWCKEHAAGHGALFPDLAQIIDKPLDDFALLITTRIEKQKQIEADRLEAQRAQIQAEEQAKAQAQARAEQDAMIAKAQAEERARIEAEQRVQAVIAAASVEDALTEEQMKMVAADAAKTGTFAMKVTGGSVEHVPVADIVTESQVRLSRASLVKCIAFEYGVEIAVAEGWLMAEFSSVEV